MKSIELTTIEQAYIQSAIELMIKNLDDKETIHEFENILKKLDCKI